MAIVMLGNEMPSGFESKSLSEIERKYRQEKPGLISVHKIFHTTILYKRHRSSSHRCNKERQDPYWHVVSIRLCNFLSVIAVPYQRCTLVF